MSAQGRKAERPGVRTEHGAVSGAGHWVHHDRLDETLRLVRSFLEEA